MLLEQGDHADGEWRRWGAEDTPDSLIHHHPPAAPDPTNHNIVPSQPLQ
jgi:hypothetical protein